MAGLFEIIVASGLISIFISTLANCILTTKTLNAQKNLENQKSSLTFLKEKVDILRNTRASFRDHTSGKIGVAIEGIYEKDPNKALKFFVDQIPEYSLTVESYKSIRYCFSNNLRETLDDLINHLERLDPETKTFFENYLGDEKNIEKINSELNKLVIREYTLLVEFEKTLLNAIDEELISAAEKLSDSQ